MAHVLTPVNPPTADLARVPFLSFSSPILKYDAHTGEVVGRVSSDDVDLDHQIADKGWLKSALATWFDIANIREMHQPKAIGKGLSIREEGNGFVLRSRIIDQSAREKLAEGVLTGYSIGIIDVVLKRDPRAMGGRIVGGKIIEVSLVDRPSNPTCKVTVVKTALTRRQKDIMKNVSSPYEREKSVEDTTTTIPAAEEAAGPSEFGMYHDEVSPSEMFWTAMKGLGTALADTTSALKRLDHTLSKTLVAKTAQEDEQDDKEHDEEDKEDDKEEKTVVASSAIDAELSKAFKRIAQLEKSLKPQQTVVSPPRFAQPNTNSLEALAKAARTMSDEDQQILARAFFAEQFK